MKAFLAAVALVALPVTAGAVTVPVTEVAPGLYYATTCAADISTATDFDFTVPEDLSNVTVSISGTGLPVALDLVSYTIAGATYDFPATAGYSAIYEFPSVATGTYTVSFTFQSTPVVPVSITVTAFGEVAPVPVPAAGVMAMGGIAALGALRARRKKA